MDYNAPGQLLGYTIQFPRGLYHLLNSEEGDSVCIEVLGDVARISEDGSVVIEEDKSSIVSNVLTDRSTDLWKTFYNWITGINCGHLNVENTKFILYTNQKGRKSIVDDFHLVNSVETANSAIDKAKVKLQKVDDSHEIWKYYNFCVNENTSIFASLLKNFELQVISKSTGFEEVRKELKKKIIPESQIEFFLDNISGWLQKTVVQKITAAQPALISWNEFYEQFLSLFDRSRKRELIDFALELPPGEIEIKKAVKARPCYVRQLDKINATDDDVLVAVADYLKAKVNRDKWIELEIIDNDVAVDFETKLSRFWENAKKKIEITQKTLSPEEKGLLLFLDCKSRQETIRDMAPPAATISGTYHALADCAMLGWHQDWETHFKT